MKIKEVLHIDQALFELRKGRLRRSGWTAASNCQMMILASRQRLPSEW